MPTYPLSAIWSEPIELLAGDIMQNQSRYAIEIVASDPDSDPARLRLPPGGGPIQVDGARTIRARALGIQSNAQSNELHVVRGF